MISIFNLLVQVSNPFSLQLVNYTANASYWNEPVLVSSDDHNGNLIFLKNAQLISS